VLLKEVFHPSSVRVGEEFAWYAVGIVSGQNETNPAVGYSYQDGPADSIYIIKNDGSRETVPRDPNSIYGVYLAGTYPPGTTVDSRDLLRGAVYPAQGKYRILIASGVVDIVNRIFYAHDIRYYEVTAEAGPTPTPTPPPTPPPSPPPSPSPTPRPIPVWVIAAVTAATLVGVVAGVALAKRE
jgi:hypothetical protein